MAGSFTPHPSNKGCLPPTGPLPPPGGQPKVDGLGRKVSTVNYFKEELVSLMTLIKEILPIGNKGDWLMVVHRHGQRSYPYGSRTKDYILTSIA